MGAESNYQNADNGNGMTVRSIHPLKHSLVITGPVASGKSTVGRLLSAELSRPLISFGAYVRAEAERRGLQTSNREALEKLGAEIVIERGHDQFLQDVLSAQDSTTQIILEGVRHVEMLQAVRRAYQEVLSVYLEVPPDVRYRRWLIRERRAGTTEARLAFDHIADAEVERNVNALIDQVEQIVTGDRAAQLIAEDILNLLEGSRA
jgi:adenylate kinase family enzyme